jgi:hypothetical protein
VGKLFLVFLDGFLHPKGLGEIVLRFDSDGEQVLEGIGQDVRKGGFVGVASRETNGSDDLYGSTQDIADTGFKHVKALLELRRATACTFQC